MSFLGLFPCQIISWALESCIGSQWLQNDALGDQTPAKFPRRKIGPIMSTCPSTIIRCYIRHINLGRSKRCRLIILSPLVRNHGTGVKSAWWLLLPTTRITIMISKHLHFPISEYLLIIIVLQDPWLVRLNSSGTAVYCLYYSSHKPNFCRN